ncbi:MAG: hypothetical protein AAF843_04000 [Bacteroidota bacterium]
MRIQKRKRRAAGIMILKGIMYLVKGRCQYGKLLLEEKFVIKYMKLTAVIFCVLLSYYGYGQGSIKSHYTNAYNCKQSSQCNAYGGGYRQDLLIKFDDNHLKWTKDVFQGFTVCDVRKRSDEYIVALKDELYVYADLTSRSIFYIDFVNDKYQTWGYGPDSGQVSKRVTAMIKMLENHATQKDVMQFLIDQTLEKE